MNAHRMILPFTIGLLYLTILLSGCDQKPETRTDLSSTNQEQAIELKSEELVAAQQEQLARLEQTSPPGKFRVENHQGTIQRIDMKLSTEQLKLSSQATPQEMASAFLEQYSNLLLVPEANLNFQLRSTKGQEEQKLFYTQAINGIPVLGSWLKIAIVEKDGQRAISRFSGRYLTDPGKYTFSPSITDAQAEEIVAKDNKLASPKELLLVEPTSLRVVDKTLIDPTFPDHTIISVWRVLFDSPVHFAIAEAFVDSTSGKLLATFPWKEEGNYELWSGGGRDTSINLCRAPSGYQLWYTEAGAEPGVSPNEDGERVYQYLQDFYGFFQDNFGRSYIAGPDEDSCPVLAYVNLSGDSYNHAFHQECFLGSAPDGCWSHAVAYGEQATTPDTVFHEMGHVFHWSEAFYTQYWDPMIVAEHVADAFSHFVGDWSGRDSDWLMFEDRPDGPLRNMEDPPSLTSLTCPGSPYPDVWVVGSHPGVPICTDPHFRSTVLSKALYLMVEGGTHRGYEIHGIGEERTWDIYFHNVTEELASDSDSLGFAEALIDSCESEVHAGIRRFSCCQVRNALASVGLARMDLDCDGVLESYDLAVWIPADRRNVLDNCPEDSNPDQEDMDTDRIGDACDDDIDGDGIPNNEDNCPLFANPSQNDRDLDRVGNGCDNCEYDSNHDQADLDGDGVGDVCDQDDDGDGVYDAYDNCPDEPGVRGSGPDGRPVFGEVFVCPPGHYCSLGCPNRRLITDFESRLDMTRDMLGPLPQPPPRLVQMFDLCKVINCGDPYPPEEQIFTIDTVFATDLPKSFNTGAPVTVRLSILDPFKNRVSESKIALLPSQAGKQIKDSIRLSFQLDPKLFKNAKAAFFTGQKNGQIPFYLEISLDFGSSKTKSLFGQSIFNFKSSVWRK